WGTGAINIDGCRVEHTTVNGGNLADNPHLRGSIRHGADTNPSSFAIRKVPGETATNPAGRWPANFVLSHHPDCEETGERTERVGGGAKASSGFVDGYEKGDGFVGKEVTSPVFACVPVCPVSELDRQSGVGPVG